VPVALAHGCQAFEGQVSDYGRGAARPRRTKQGDQAIRERFQALRVLGASVPQAHLAAETWESYRALKSKLLRKKTG
jgi:hypothetical protein